MVHLTNDAVQKKGEEYGKFENGNKISYSEFQTYLDMISQDSKETKMNFLQEIYPKMKVNIILLTRIWQRTQSRLFTAKSTQINDPFPLK